MNGIDYSEFLTRPPPAFSGSAALSDAFTALAQARRQRELKELEDRRLRENDLLDYNASMAGHAEATRHNQAGEQGQAAVRTETGRHNLATEADQNADREQRKQEAMSKLLADKDFRAALGSSDPNALAPWAPVMQANGITVADVMDPGTGWQAGDTPNQQPTGIPEMDEPVDAVTGPAPVAQGPTPTGRKAITGPSGLSFGFDPATNALAQAKAGARIQGSMTEAASSMGPQAAEGTRDAAQLARAYVAAGMDPIAAAEKAGAAATALAGQASARRNADVTAARGGARTEQGAERLELSRGSYAWDKATKVLSQFGAKEVIVQDRKFGQMVAQLSGKPNPATDAMIAGSFVKMAQGGTGVISDSDMKQFWDKIGGWGIKGEGMLQGILDGTIPSQKRALVLQAVRDLARNANSNLSRIKGALRTAMENDPNVTPEMRTAVLKTYGAEAPAAGADETAKRLLGKYK